MTRLFVCILFALTAAGAPPEWPQFRGPASNPVGANARLPERWSKTQNVEWAMEIPGRGWSSPVVSDGKVFLTAVVTEGKSKPPETGTEYSNQYVAELLKQGLPEAEAIKRVTERDIELPDEVVLHYFLYCLDLQTGKMRWKSEFHAGRPPGGRHRKNSFASETPVTDGKHVFVYVANLGLYAYDMNGKQIWKTPLDAFPIYLEFGTGSSPVLNDELLIIVNDNQKQQFIAAFDKKTGKQVWRTDRAIGDKSEGVARSGWTTPFIWRTPERTEVVTVGPGTAVSYDLEGRELWRLSGMSATPVPSPFASNGLLYINGGRSRPVFALRPGAKGEVGSDKLVWSDPRGGTYLPTPVAYDGALYALTETGILTRFDAATGKVTYKSRLDPAAGTFTTSPWAYNGKVFFLNEEGKTWVVAAGENFQVQHVNELDEMTQATPAIVGDRLLIRTETKLYSIRK